MIVSLVVAMTGDYVIGNKGRLPWKSADVPGELRLFQATTYDHPVIMGRKTWQSLAPRSQPLMRRLNIILSRDSPWGPIVYNTGSAVVRVAPSLDAALDLCGDAAEAFVIGGASVYREAYPRASRIYLSLVEGDYPGEVRFPFPVLDASDWAWDPRPVKGQGWTRHILCKTPALSRQEES